MDEGRRPEPWAGRSVPPAFCERMVIGMMIAGSSQLRARARAALNNRWGVSLAVSLVAWLLGAGGSGPSLNGNFSYRQGRLGFSSNFSNSFGLWQNHSVSGLLTPAVLAVIGVVVIIAVSVGIALFLIGSPLRLGRRIYYTQLQRAQPAPFGTLLSRFNIFGRAVGLRLFTAVFIWLWMLLLIVPGIVASFRYAMAPYLMAEHPEMGIREAVNISKRMMKGHKADLFVLYLTFIGWAILATLPCGLGWLWLNPYIQAAEAEFYLEVSYQRPQTGFAGPLPGTAGSYGA